MQWLRDGRISLGLIIVIGSLLVFVSALAVLSTAAFDRAHKDYHTARAYDETRRQFEQRCAGLEGEEIFGCLRDQIESAREPSRAEEDVQAQKQMARWALWMLVVTGAVGFGTITVAFLGVHWVKETLVVTREAMLDTRKIGKAQVRAYLTCSGAEFGIDRTWLQCHATIKNSGNSHATAVKIIAAVNIFGIEGAERPSARTTGHTQTIPAGGSGIAFLLWSHDQIGTELFDRLATGHRDFQIDCRIQWEDVFDETQTAICFLSPSAMKMAALSGKNLLQRGKLKAYNRTR